MRPYIMNNVKNENHSNIKKELHSVLNAVPFLFKKYKLLKKDLTKRFDIGIIYNWNSGKGEKSMRILSKTNKNLLKEITGGRDSENDINRIKESELRAMFIAGYNWDSDRQVFTHPIAGDYTVRRLREILEEAYEHFPEVRDL